VPGDTVPVWVFYWVLGLVSAGAIVWAAITKILWDRGTKAQEQTLEARERTSGLSEEEKGWLRQLYHWHKVVDDDQIPLWYIPRSWVDLINRLHADHADVKALLTRLTEQDEDLISDLRAQLKESRGLQAQQQTKMLKLAVRVQRAVEALAGLQPPAIEHDLDDTGEEASS
jgi:hypothetical protein